MALSWLVVLAPSCVAAALSWQAPVEDTLSLVQGQVVQHLDANFGETLGNWLRGVKNGWKKRHRRQRASRTNCTKHPVLCSDQMRCHTEPETQNLHKRIATEGGHANLKSWCIDNGLFANTLVQHCIINGDLSKSGKLVFQQQVENGADHLDASYCFLEKHCSNSRITANTTLSEAELACNERFGRNWTNVGFALMERQQRWWQLSGVMNVKTGFHSREPTQAFSKLACAMGNYHCDVVYCKENYCQNEYYVKKYGHLLEAEPLPGDP